MNKTMTFCKIVCICFLCRTAVFAKEILPAIEEITKKPPAERIQVLQSLFQDNRIPSDAKVPYFKLFAQEVRHLSPRYGKSNIKIDTKHWIAYLSESLKLSPDDQNTVFALSQLLINDQQYKRALQIIEPYHKKYPCHETTAWYNYCTHKLAGDPPQEELPVFDIHFCILTNNPDANKLCTREQLEREIYILNHTFRTLNKKPLVMFRYKSATFYKDIQNDRSPLEQMTNNGQPFDSNQFNEYYNQCINAKIRDHHAVNFYIYNSCNSKDGYQDITSHGRRNSNRPYILLDWQRLNNNIQNPSAHEMGHAFGLGHVAVPGARFNSPTNIMCSTQYGFGSGGNRRLGFTEAQTAIILYHAKRTQNRFATSAPDILK